jgi:hypothetical protein
MADIIIEASRERLNLTATSTIAGGGVLMGVFVSSASSTPTLKFADTAGTIANTFTPEGGRYYPIPTLFTGTLTITVSGTVDCTVFYGR